MYKFLFEYNIHKFWIWCETNVQKFQERKKERKVKAPVKFETRIIISIFQAVNTYKNTENKNENRNVRMEVSKRSEERKKAEKKFYLFAFFICDYTHLFRICAHLPVFFLNFFFRFIHFIPHSHADKTWNVNREKISLIFSLLFAVEIGKRWMCM